MALMGETMPDDLVCVPVFSDDGVRDAETKVGEAQELLKAAREQRKKRLDELKQQQIVAETKAQEEEHQRQQKEQLAGKITECVNSVLGAFAQQQEGDKARAEAEAAVKTKAEAEAAAEATSAAPEPEQQITTVGPKPLFTLWAAIAVLTLTVIGETTLTHMGLDIGMFRPWEIWLVSAMAGVLIPYVLNRCEEAFPRLGKVLAALGAAAGMISVIAFVYVRAENSLAAANQAMGLSADLSLQPTITFWSVCGFAALAVVAAVAGEQCIGTVTRWYDKPSVVGSSVGSPLEAPVEPPLEVVNMQEQGNIEE